MKVTLFTLISNMLLLTACSDEKSKGIKTDQVKKESTDSLNYVRFLDSLKALYNAEIAILDSLIGVKSSMSGGKDELNKKIDKQKKEIENLLMRIEESTIIH